MSRPSGPVRCEASVWKASSCRLLEPLGAMNGWRGGSGAKTGFGVHSRPMNDGRSFGPSGIGSAAAGAAATSSSARAARDLMAGDHLVDEAVLDRLVGLEEAVALHV